MVILWMSFKPYYNWNTFNTKVKRKNMLKFWCFKPYYNWNTFNTGLMSSEPRHAFVLNLIITGIPSIL